MVGDTADARTKTDKRWPMVEEEGRLPEEVPTLLLLKSGDGLRDLAVCDLTNYPTKTRMALFYMK